MRITYDEDGKPTAHLDNANVNDSDVEKILYGNARSSDNFSTRELMNELEREVKKTKDDLDDILDEYESIEENIKEARRNNRQAIVLSIVSIIISLLTVAVRIMQTTMAR